MPHRLAFSLLSVFFVVFATTLSAQDQANSWSQWRGDSQRGVAKGNGFPVKWNEDNGVKWKLEIPGKGGSTPVIASGVAYLTSGADDKNILFAIDLKSGKLRWKQAVGTDRGGKHKKGSGSNPSAVVDDGRVYVYFRSGDMACVSTDGKMLWQMNLQDKFGEDTLWWDLASSPTLTRDAVIVAVMQTGPSYLVALDKKSGDVLWKQDRNLGAPEEAAQSYTTPLLVNVDGSDLIAVLGADHLTLHDASTGKTKAKLGGFNPGEDAYFRSIASPAASGRYVVCPYARGETVTCVRMDQLLSGKGKESISWFRDDLGCDVPSPAIDGGRVYLAGDGRKRGQVNCLDLKSGKTIWSVKLPKSRVDYVSSPLLAGDHLYVTAENGTTHVIGPVSSDQPKLISNNRLDDDELFTTASLVPYGSDFLIRTKNYLYRVGG